MDNKENTVFHSITLLAHCGGGAFGEVYYGRDISGRCEAVKIISKKKYGTGWERELKGVINYRKITENNPNLMQIYHVEEDEESFFYTMEPADSLTQGEYKPDTLAGRLENGPLPEAEIYPVLSGIFQGIKTIHEAGFAHRDIKPDNIIFVNGKPKLGDIGLMSSITAGSMTQLAGTLDFLPPEQRIGSSSTEKKSSQKNDLYALGKVIYCVITGNQPQEYPSVPVHIGHSLSTKLFLRLAFRLCDRDLYRRLEKINQLETELAEIEHKLKFGETFQDSIRQAAKDVVLFSRTAVLHVISGTKKHYLLVSGAALFCVLTGYYALRQLLFHQKPSMISELRDKSIRETPSDYLHCSFSYDRFSVDVPKTWKIFDRQQLIRNIKKDDEPFAKNVKMEALRNTFALISPGKSSDMIQITQIPLSAKELNSIPDEKLSRELIPFFGEEWKSFSIRRLSERQHQPVFFIARQNARTILTSFIFPQKNMAVAITLYQNANSSCEIQEQFYAMLDSFTVREKEVVYSVDPDGRTPFMQAAAERNFKEAEHLLTAGANVDEKTFGGNSALHFAVKDGQADVAAFLLEHSANINIQDDQGMTPLVLASRRGKAEIVRLLLKGKANREQRDTQGFTALAHAVAGTQRECAEILLNAGADPNITVHNELRTPLIMLAVVQNDPEILKLLLSHKIDIQTTNESGENALLRVLDITLLNRQPEKIAFAKILIEAGIHVNQQNKKGLTPLMYAAALSDSDLIHLLLDHGAKKELKDAQGHTAADYCDGKKCPEGKKILSLR